MPYTTASTDLPANVKKLDAKLKAQWVEIFNSVLAKCQDDGGDDCEASAMIQANGVIKKETQEENMKLNEAYQNLSEVTKEVIDALTALNLAIAALSDAETPAENDEPETETEETTEDETPEPEAEITSESFAESIAGAITIQEKEQPASVRDPLAISMRLIKAGPGNPADNHYYPGDMLKRDAHIFEGVKMYTVDHDEGERSERTEVAKIRKITGFEEDGSPIADIIIFDPAFAEKTRNRYKAGELDSLECSILASGVAKETEIDGTSYNVVESIESAKAVDFVTKAGAGGKALAIAESDKGTEQEPETPEQEPILEKDKVLEVLRETNLPAPTQARLEKSEYKTEAELDEAITEAIAEVKAVSGSGQPLGTKSTEQAVPTRTAEQIQEDDKNWYDNLREGYSLAPRV